MRPENYFPEIVNEGPKRTARDMAEIVMQDALVDILLEWETAFVRARNAAPIGAALIEMYAEALVSIRTTAAELKECRKALLLTKTFFPSVAEIADWIKDNRNGRLVGYVECLDSAGNSWLAPRERVLNGRLVDEGGNGVPCEPNAAVADLLEGIYEARSILGVAALTQASEAQLTEIGHVKRGGEMPALPSRNVHERPTMSPEQVAELERLARENAEARRNAQ